MGDGLFRLWEMGWSGVREGARSLDRGERG